MYLRGSIRYAAICLLGCAAGCVAVPAPSVSNQLHPGSRYLLHLPGVAGVTFFDHWWLDALRDAQAVDTADFYDWTGHHGWIDVLHAIDRNHAAAGRIAA